MKPVIEDEVLKKLEDIIKDVGSGSEVDPRVYSG